MRIEHRAPPIDITTCLWQSSIIDYGVDVPAASPVQITRAIPCSRPHLGDGDVGAEEVELDGTGCLSFWSIVDLLRDRGRFQFGV